MKRRTDGERRRDDWWSKDSHHWALAPQWSVEAAVVLLGPGLRCCWARTILLHRRPRSQSAQECGRGSTANNVQRSDAILGPTRLCLVLLSSRGKQEKWQAGAQESAGGDGSLHRQHNPTTATLTALSKNTGEGFLHLFISENSVSSMWSKVKMNNNVALPPNGANSSYNPALVCRAHECHKI